MELVRIAELLGTQPGVTGGFAVSGAQRPNRAGAAAAH